MYKVSFVAFTFAWIALRFLIYPFVILPSFIHFYHHQFPSFPLFCFLRFLYSILVLLIIIWTYFVLKFVYFTIYLKFEPEDGKSDDEEEVIQEPKMENSTTTTKDVLVQAANILSI